MSFSNPLKKSINTPTTAAVENEAPPLWEYITIADYKLPAEPVTHTARKGLSVFRHLLQRNKTETESPLKTEAELSRLPAYLLERIAPSPPWNDAAAALCVELDHWLSLEVPDPPVVVLVGPPHSGHTDILRAWAEQLKWPILKPPSAKQILTCDESWLTRQNDHSGFWVFPVLEKAWLRHSEGLNLTRRFLDNAYAGKLGRGVIGCDSWAWAFLRHVWQGSLPVVLTLQSRDQNRLAAHFQKPADYAGKQQILFRQSDNGHYVLPLPETTDISGKKSHFLQLSAAYSRGIFGVAQAIWRAGLRTEPDKTMEDKNETEDEKIPHQTLWITPWNQLKHPSLPDGTGDDEAIILHTLLLHNGLPVELLQQLVPLSSNQVLEILFRLEASGIVIQQNDDWRISPRGYPAARQLLQMNSYMLDHF